MGFCYNVSEQFVLNNRWLLDTAHNRLIDLEDTKCSATLQSVDMRLLSILVRSPHTLLRRQHLLHEGWRVYGFEVCENSLTQVICRLRGAFQELHPERTYIKTVPRIGYCFMADVRSAEETDRQMLCGGGSDVQEPNSSARRFPKALRDFFS